MNFIKKLTELPPQRACVVQTHDKVYVFEIIDDKLIDIHTEKLLDVSFDVFADKNICHYIFVDKQLALLFLPYIKD